MEQQNKRHEKEALSRGQHYARLLFPSDSPDLQRFMKVADKRRLPPTRRQLWCVFEPDHASYQLPDVPVELCTAMLYCCLELTSRGIRYPRPEDEGHLGVDVFYTLRDRSRGLSLYVLLGDGVQTTAVFSNQARPGNIFTPPILRPISFSCCGGWTTRTVVVIMNENA